MAILNDEAMHTRLSPRELQYAKVGGGCTLVSARFCWRSISGQPCWTVSQVANAPTRLFARGHCLLIRLWWCHPSTSPLLLPVPARHAAPALGRAGATSTSAGARMSMGEDVAEQAWAVRQRRTTSCASRSTCARPCWGTCCLCWCTDEHGGGCCLIRLDVPFAGLLPARRAAPALSDAGAPAAGVRVADAAEQRQRRLRHGYRA